LYEHFPRYPTTGSRADQLAFISDMLDEEPPFPKEVHDLWCNFYDEYPIFASLEHRENQMVRAMSTSSVRSADSIVLRLTVLFVLACGALPTPTSSVKQRPAGPCRRSNVPEYPTSGWRDDQRHSLSRPCTGSHWLVRRRHDLNDLCHELNDSAVRKFKQNRSLRLASRQHRAAPATAPRFGPPRARRAGPPRAAFALEQDSLY